MSLLEKAKSAPGESAAPAQAVRGVRHPPVLMVGNYLSGTGASRTVCEELSAQLIRRGWSVITTSRHKSRVLRLFDMVSTTWRKRASYAAAQIDVYSGPAFRWAEAVAWTLRRAGKPYVLTLHGGNLPAFAAKYSGRVRRLLAGAAIVTAPSRYLQEALLPWRRDIVQIPNGVDLGAYPFQSRREIAPRLVWLRAFSKIYNPGLAVRVLADLVRDYPKARLLMVGPDKGDGSRQETERIAQECQVQDKVEFAGGVPKSDVPRWIGQGDIFLNTTNFDNTPVSVIEALASGLCVVSTNVGGVPDLVTDEKDALLVPPGDLSSMSRAVRRLLTDRELAARLSVAGRRTVEAFDWSRVIPQWEELLQRVAVAGGSQP